MKKRVWQKHKLCDTWTLFEEGDSPGDYIPLGVVERIGLRYYGRDRNRDQIYNGSVKFHATKAVEEAAQ